VRPARTCIPKLGQEVWLTKHSLRLQHLSPDFPIGFTQVNLRQPNAMLQPFITLDSRRMLYIGGGATGFLAVPVRAQTDPFHRRRGLPAVISAKAPNTAIVSFTRDGSEIDAHLGSLRQKHHPLKPLWNSQI